MRVSMLSLVPFALAACETPDALKPVPEVRVATEAEVSTCTPLRIITTTPGVSGSLAGPTAIELARNETLATARDAGANAFVFDEAGAEFFVRGTAYQC